MIMSALISFLFNEHLRLYKVKAIRVSHCNAFRCIHKQCKNENTRKREIQRCNTRLTKAKHWLTRIWTSNYKRFVCMLRFRFAGIMLAQSHFSFGSSLSPAALLMLALCSRYSIHLICGFFFLYTFHWNDDVLLVPLYYFCATFSINVQSNNE